MSQKDRVTWIS